MFSDSERKMNSEYAKKILGVCLGKSLQEARCIMGKDNLHHFYIL